MNHKNKSSCENINQTSQKEEGCEKTVPFRKLMCGDEFDYLLKKYPNTYLLISYVARHVRIYNGNPDGLKIGECLIGDYKAMGIKTEDQYRYAKKIAVERHHLEIVETCRNRKNTPTVIPTIGTKVRLISTNLYDANLNHFADPNPDRTPTEPRPNPDEQRSIINTRIKEEQQQQQQQQAPVAKSENLPAENVVVVVSSFQNHSNSETFDSSKPSAKDLASPNPPIANSRGYRDSDPSWSVDKVIERARAEKKAKMEAEKKLSQESNITDIIRTQSQPIVDKQVEKKPEIYFCLNSQNLTDEQKRDITKNFDEERVKYALKWISAQTKPRNCLISSIKWAAETKPEITLTAQQKKDDEDLKIYKSIQANRAWIKAIKSTNDIESQDFKINDNYITYKDGSHRFGTIPYINVSFREQVECVLRKANKWDPSFLTIGQNSHSLVASLR